MDYAIGHMRRVHERGNNDFNMLMWQSEKRRNDHDLAIDERAEWTPIAMTFPQLLNDKKTACFCGHLALLQGFKAAGGAVNHKTGAPMYLHHYGVPAIIAWLELEQQHHREFHLLCAVAFGDHQAIIDYYGVRKVGHITAGQVADKLTVLRYL